MIELQVTTTKPPNARIQPTEASAIATTQPKSRNLSMRDSLARVGWNELFGAALSEKSYFRQKLLPGVSELSPDVDRVLMIRNCVLKLILVYPSDIPFF